MEHKLNSAFQPDYRNVLDAAWNRRPKRLPLYEHLINVDSMEKIYGFKFGGLIDGDEKDRARFFELYCGFFKQMGYDCVSFEVCVSQITPGGGALLGEHIGVIRDRASFESYPWDDLPRLFWETARPRFDALARALPPGMKCVGGIGNGIFEISEDLVGYEALCLLQYDDPELFADLFRKIGDLHFKLWREFLPRYGGYFAVCRTGDDLGYKTSTLLAPETLLTHVIPQYRRMIGLIHESGLPYLQHSCGKIFPVMDAWITAGINAKHSNEDCIAPYDEWIERYRDRIGLFGGIDTDRLCRMNPDDLYQFVVEEGTRFRKNANGYALGSGNSIPGYVPTEGYLAMVRAAHEIRRREGTP
jgi:uroporphyrinogen decarboxylase